MFATRYGYLDLVKLLVESGANLDLKNPLIAAQYSQFSNYYVVKYLLEAGANPNASGLLLNAALLKLRDVVSLLLVHGAIYEQRYEYIDQETGMPVNKIHRYNDCNGDMPEKFILQAILQVVPPMPSNPTKMVKVSSTIAEPGSP